MKRRVLAVTGIRSEYDILAPVLRELQAREGVDVRVVVSGAHLSELHGFTSQWIERDGFEIVDRVDSLLRTDRQVQRPKGVARLMEGLSQTVEREHPDVLLVVGDREEAIATAVVGNYLRIVTAHIGGGDSAIGNADDPIRVAVSKLAHLHFAFTEEYGKNLVALGEEEFRVHVSGNPALSGIEGVPSISSDELSAVVGMQVEANRFIIFLMHPLSSTLESTGSDIKVAFRAVTDFASQHDLQTVVIRPNSDPGSAQILQELEAVGFVRPRVAIVPSLPRPEFVNLVRQARCLVGNSSMGLLEAPGFGLPVVNIGPRQQGRTNAGNVIFVRVDRNEISSALDTACFDASFRSSVMKLRTVDAGSTAAATIAHRLAELDFQDERWINKRRLYPSN